MPFRSLYILKRNSESLHPFLQDRFAEGRFTPAIDDSQDWVLDFGEQENGYTILAFSRPLTSCDPNDLNIKVKSDCSFVTVPRRRK